MWIGCHCYFSFGWKRGKSEWFIFNLAVGTRQWHIFLYVGLVWNYFLRKVQTLCCWNFWHQYATKVPELEIEQFTKYNSHFNSQEVTDFKIFHQKSVQSCSAPGGTHVTWLFLGIRFPFYSDCQMYTSVSGSKNWWKSVKCILIMIKDKVTFEK